MRSLFISNCVPEPLNSGSKQRVFHLLRAIARVSEVTFVSPGPDCKHIGAPAAFRSLCKEAFFFSHESFGWPQDFRMPALVRKSKNILRHFSLKPLLWQSYRSTEGEQLVEQLCLRQFDLVWVERLVSLSLLPSWLKTRVIVDLDDLEHRRLCRELALAKFHKRMLLDYLEFLKLRRLECALPRASGEFVVCSETDRRILDPGAKTRVVPNGVDIPPLVDDADDDASAPILLFVGSMAYGPNVDAVQFFAREVLPLVRREVPDAIFMVVGRDPSPAVSGLNDNTTVVVTGTVPDVQPYLRKATVVVVPLRVGGGTRIKILEAMAHQRPVVATSIGAEGLEVEPGSHLLIANSASAFADACARLLRDRNMRQELARRAYDVVRAKYDWSKIERKVAQIVLQETVGGSAQPEESLSSQRLW